MPDAGCILGFDYGKQRTGVAVGQTLTRTAQALTTLQSQNGKPDWKAIQQLVEEWRPVRLVVGLPLHLDGQEQEMTNAARHFANQLHGRFGLPVSHMDERLSSAEAEQILAEMRSPGGYDKQAVDKLAAQLILQSWLEQNFTQ